MESPSQNLAEKLAARLVAEGLLTPERGKRIEDRLPSGGVKAEDWKLEIELSSKDEAVEVAE